MYEENLADKLHQTLRWRPAVAETATSFAALPEAGYEDLILLLVDSGEDRSLGILMCICGINKVLLDPYILAKALKVAEPVTDISFPYKIQNSDAIEPLLEVVQAEDISWERQAFGALIASELAVRHACHQAEVKRILTKLSQRIPMFEANFILDQALELLDSGESDIPRHLWVIEQDALQILPEEKPPTIIGGDFTIRRPVPKIGRNAPCPCGSGKKYKKCCLEKDQQLLRDASPYEGVTMTQLRSTPDLANDAEMIKKMRAYELKNLKPARLNEEQLFQAYRGALNFGMREFAFDLLFELKGRPNRQDFAFEHMEDLLESALDMGDMNVAQKTMETIPSEKLHDADRIRAKYNLIKNMAYLTPLEELSQQALKEEENEDLICGDYGLLALSTQLENISPALSIAFARAAVMGRRDAYFDNEMLIDVVRSCRADLGHEPLEDPLEDFFEWMMNKSYFDFKDDEKDRQILELREKVIQANRLSAKKQNELKEKEIQLNKLSKRLELNEKIIGVPHNKAGTGNAPSNEERRTAADLHRQIENLKAEISLQQHDRRQLRRELQNAQKKIQAQNTLKTQDTPYDDQGIGIEPETVQKKIIIPDFKPAFKRNCESLPMQVVAKALRAATDFASGDKSVWLRTKPIEALSRIFRIQIGRRHRLLIFWEPEVRLDILDLIHRKQLETWIKSYSGSPDR